MLSEFDEYGPLASGNINDLFTTIHFDQRDRIIGKKKDNLFSGMANMNIVENVFLECEKISNKLDIHPDVAFLLLEKQDWSSNDLFNLWVTDSQSLLASIGLNTKNCKNDPNLSHPNEGQECIVCADFYEADEMWSLPCGHCFCTNCWKDHASLSLERGHIRISCQQGENCMCLLPPHSVEMLCGKDTYQSLLGFVSDHQIQRSNVLTHCPNPRCSRPLYVLDMGPCSVLKCLHCNFEFCKDCDVESHAPASCDDMNKWQLYTGDDLMQQRLLGPNVKKCPRCHTTIEKNEGCNHMTCQFCKHEFCWMCLEDWKTHPKNYYDCEAYNADTDPYLKKPDDINPQFLGIYHDNYIKSFKQNNSHNENKNKLLLYICKRIPETSMLKKSTIEEMVNVFLDQLYWGRRVIQWSYVKLFIIRHNQFRAAGVPIENQETSELTHTTEYLLIKSMLNELELAVGPANLICESFMKTGTTNVSSLYSTLKTITKSIKIYRNQLLKLADPHY